MGRPIRFIGLRHCKPILSKGICFGGKPESGGEGGIRTPGWVSPTLAFEASSFNRSDTSPLPIVMVTAKRGKQLPNLFNFLK